MNFEFTLRDYTPSDWPAVCRVHDAARPIELAACGFPAGRKIRTLAEAAEEDGFFRSRSAVAVLGGGDGGRVIGFASVDGAYLSSLYVDPEFHRRGVGRRLVEHVAHWMGAEGYTCVGAGNLAAMALYGSMRSPWGAMEVACRFPGEAEGVGGECVRMAFATSSHRWRAARPTELALKLEAQKRGASVEELPREWAAEM